MGSDDKGYLLINYLLKRCQFAIVLYGFPMILSCSSPTFSGFIVEKFLMLLFIWNILSIAWSGA